MLLLLIYNPLIRLLTLMKWLDAHTHLDTDELYPHKEEIFRRAQEAGVTKMLLVNSEATEMSFERTLNCLRVPDNIETFASFGIHPHHAKLYSSELETDLLQHLQHPGVIAFGEIGLDFFYDFSPRDIQIPVLQKQLELALDRNLPVVIHCRDAYGKLADVLSEMKETWRGMIHCFTGTPQEAETLMRLGFYISFSGIVTFRKAAVLQDAARIVPISRILIETDAPYLAPVPHRGKTNEPAFVAHTGNFIAELKQIPPEAFSHQIFTNFQNLFGV